MTATIQGDVLQTSSGGPTLFTKQQTLKNWCNHNDVAVTITASFNVSSIGHNGTGDDYIFLINAMQSSVYAAFGLGGAYDTGPSDANVPIMGERRSAYTAIWHRIITTTGSSAAYSCTTVNSGTLGILA